MEHAKKMMLVDPKLMESAPNVVDTPRSIVGVTQPESNVIDMTLTSLNKGLHDILQRDNIHVDEKVKLYSNILQQYLTMRQKQKDVYALPSAVTITSAPPSSEEESKQLLQIQQQVIDSVPKPMQKNAKMLLDRVKQDPRLGWTPRGELIVEEQVIPQSNIIDLINDLLRKRKNFNPQGWRELSRKLYEGNVPTNLIRNADRLSFMRGTPYETMGGDTSPDRISSSIRELSPSRATTPPPSTRKKTPSSRKQKKTRSRRPSQILAGEEWLHY